MKVGDWTLGSDNVKFGTFSLRDGDKSFLPPAMTVWAFTLKKIGYLMDVYTLNSLPKESEHLIRSTLVQQSIVMLVSGMEVFAKARFIEMEKNGKQPNKEALLKTFTRQDMTAQIEHEISNGKSVTEALAEHDLIKFQNWKKLRCAYLKGYNIDVESLDYQTDDLISKIGKYIHWRHRITHAAEEMTMLNVDQIREKGFVPVMANKNTLDMIKGHFVDLVETIDKTTK